MNARCGSPLKRGRLALQHIIITIAIINHQSLYLRHRTFHGSPVRQVRRFADVLARLILTRDLVNGASHLFDSVDRLVRFAFDNPSVVGPDRRTLSLYLFPIF